METNQETNQETNLVIDQSAEQNANENAGSAAEKAPNAGVGDAFLHKDASVTNMIFGIVSILLSGAPLLSVASIIFGALAIHKSKTNKAFALEKGLVENNMNKAGFITGIIGTVFGSFMTLLYIVLLLVVLFVTVGAVSTIPADTIAEIIEGAVDGAMASGALPLS